MMSIGIVGVDFPKTHQFSRGLLSPEQQENPVPFNVLLEDQLGARKDTHGNSRFVDGSKTARISVRKRFGYQFFANSGRSGSSIMKTVVAHRSILHDQPPLL